MKKHLFGTKDNLHEECAVAGVSLKEPIAAGVVYNALLSLQHRGQEGAGIATVDGKTINLFKDTGLVSEVFNAGNLGALPETKIAIGHNRYSTSGANKLCNTQPFLTEYLTGRHALAHNGNITNAKALRRHLEDEGIDFKASSDSEVISALIALYAAKQNNIEDAVIRAAKMLEGAFSLVIASSGRLIALRDAHGFRPLCIGKSGLGVMAASESCALDSCGFEFDSDVRPGEMVVIEDGEVIRREIVLPEEKKGMCIFEYVYFARPDSVLDGQSVYDARYNMGVRLAEEYKISADAVCGVPDSGLEAAIGYSAASGIPLISGFVKNRYIGRSFIFPTQSQRESAVRLKLNPLKATVCGKSIILIDDSIVRGTTAKKIIASLKNAGAKEVHMLSSAPPFIHTCHYGTDVDSEDNLIANKITVDKICKEIGADTLGFISVEGLKKACGDSAVPFCTGCFDGRYPTEEIKLSKDELEQK